VVGLGPPPPPCPQACVPPPPLVRGGGHTRWRGKGWESPNSDEGTHSVVFYIYVLCAVRLLKEVLVKSCTLRRLTRSALFHSVLSARFEPETKTETEPVFLNVYVAQESIPSNEFRQPM
jgi:hypothetical protein